MMGLFKVTTYSFDNLNEQESSVNSRVVFKADPQADCPFPIFKNHEL